jgi:aspartate kinase
MTKKIIVNKFGGGILKKELIPIIAKRLKDQLASGYSPIVVVSAMPGITDSLVSFLVKLNESPLKKNEMSLLVENFIIELKKVHGKIINDIGFNKEWREEIHIELEKLFFELEADLNAVPRTVLGEALLRTVLSEDKIVSYGEKFSATILSFYFNLSDIPTRRLLAEEIPIVTDDNWKNANIDYKSSEKNLRQKLSGIKEIPVITGFTGITKNGETTILGRGGTDTTACLVGAAIRAEKVILWKDVGGVLSADPKIVPEAKTIPFVSYQESEEAGKIIHDKAIQYAKLFKTSVEIVSLTNPKLKTIVGEEKSKKKGAKIVSYKKDLTLFLITDEIIKGNELLAIVSQAFAKNKVDVILISNTRYSLQIVAENNGSSNKVIEELKKKVFSVETHPVSMVFLVGNFNVSYVNDFNSLLIKLKTDLEISAFLYKNCTRLEAVIKTDKIENIIRSLYKKFIR